MGFVKEAVIINSSSISRWNTKEKQLQIVGADVM